MERAVLALASLLLSVSAAEAFCVSLPDDAGSYYVQNRTAQALCLQHELALSTEAQAERARIEVELGNLAIRIEQQRLRQIQLLQPPPL